MEIKALQLRLQDQKNELCTSLSMKKQTEMDSMVSLLERQYRSRLAEIEAVSESQIQEYLRVPYNIISLYFQTKLIINIKIKY